MSPITALHSLINFTCPCAVCPGCDGKFLARFPYSVAFTALCVRHTETLWSCVLAHSAHTALNLPPSSRPQYYFCVCSLCGFQQRGLSEHTCRAEAVSRLTDESVENYIRLNSTLTVNTTDGENSSKTAYTYLYKPK